MGEQEGAQTNSIAATPVLDSFYEDGLTENQQFSILFCGDDAAMSIGGVDESQIKGDAGISYVDTQMTYGEMYGYFLVEVESISVANPTVSTDSQTLNEIGGVLVDSGTTLIYLPSTVSQAIETEIEKSVPDLKTTFFEWSTCVTESELDSFPDLTIALNDYNLKLKPKQYLLWYGGCYYWGISTSSIGIIGNVALQDKLVVFDKDSNTIGFANGDCSAYGGDSYSDDDDTTSKLASMDAGARSTSLHDPKAFSSVQSCSLRESLACSPSGQDSHTRRSPKQSPRKSKTANSRSVTWPGFVQSVPLLDFINAALISCTGRLTS